MPDARDDNPRNDRRATEHAVVAMAYLALVLWILRPILPAPASTFPHPVRADAMGHTWELLFQADQKLTAALATYDARTLPTRPRHIMDGPQCYPLPNAMTLGHQMMGAGLRSILPFALTGNPIVTYNVLVLGTFWLAAIGMYGLAFYWTRSVGATFVAGLVFTWIRSGLPGSETSTSSAISGLRSLCCSSTDCSRQDPGVTPVLSRVS